MAAIPRRRYFRPNRSSSIRSATSTAAACCSLEGSRLRCSHSRAQRREQHPLERSARPGGKNRRHCGHSSHATSRLHPCRRLAVVQRRARHLARWRVLTGGDAGDRQRSCRLTGERGSRFFVPRDRTAGDDPSRIRHGRTASTVFDHKADDQVYRTAQIFRCLPFLANASGSPVHALADQLDGIASPPRSSRQDTPAHQTAINAVESFRERDGIGSIRNDRLLANSAATQSGC